MKRLSFVFFIVALLIAGVAIAAVVVRANDGFVATASAEPNTALSPN